MFFPFYCFSLKFVCWRNECSLFYLLPVHSSSVYKFLKIYLLLLYAGSLLLRAGLLSSWGVWASHCSGFSCGARVYGEHASVVGTHRLSCPHSMWDVPRPGIKPVSYGLQGKIINTGKPYVILLLVMSQFISLKLWYTCVQSLKLYCW